jgi:uncharacterized DUF497 family protein
LKRKPFHWDDWNKDHIAKHSVTEAEAEFVVRRAKPPYPRKIGGGKFLVWGPTEHRRVLQVIFVHRKAEAIPYERLTLRQAAELEESSGELAYIIHARDLTETEKAQFRRTK